MSSATEVSESVYIWERVNNFISRDFPLISLKMLPAGDLFYIGRGLHVPTKDKSAADNFD